MKAAQAKQMKAQMAQREGQMAQNRVQAQAKNLTPKLMANTSKLNIQG
ncbi:MAG: hypothetical protein HEQ32_07590 [Vampirovibrio sp.]